MQDRIITTYNALESLNATAKACGVSVKTVYKVLCSAGVYPSEQAERVNRLAETMSIDEIANRLNITPKTVRSYLPYTRGTYLTDNKSINAQRIAACRERKKAQK
jgi:transposase